MGESLSFEEFDARREALLERGRRINEARAQTEPDGEEG